MLLQVLWQLKLSWDESLPIHLYTEWRRYQESLLHLNSLQIDRNAVPYKNTIELHGFCDASEKAYGACIYVRSMNDKGHISSKLLCSKSRVAPLQSTTIPRLELCAAVLLARLMVKVESTLSLKIDHKFYWTDSTIVLAWINTTTRQLKTFAANRVAEIQTTTTSSEWRHVSTNENPADLLSRGSPPDQLIDCNLWWQGPTWLLQHHNDWLQSTYNLKGVEIPEKRNIAIISNVVQQKIDLFDKFSSLSKLQRVVSFVRRFIHNALCRVQKTPQHTLTGPLSTNELYHATRVLLKSAQGDAFAAELKHFTKGKPIQPESCLRNLNLFLDSEGIIRVGGRLRNSNNQFNEKHPIILPKNHQITRLLIEYVHRTELHAGAQATLAKIRTKYWPLGGRSIVRHVIRKCIKCFKAKPIMSQPLMGDLPMARVQPARPFINVGVDYCGPFTIRNSPTRRASTYKAYVAIFVCMAVKAVHIELVSGLDSNSFISALKRFIARRGMISNIYSDNGTNFVKANKDLKELQKMFTTTENIEKITNVLAEQGVSWHFIPPKAPNFGGLWEAAVKSFKHHFRRIVSNALLTFEEFYTICTQIEAILNSRPLIPLSEDPSDLSILTPSHFLIGDSLRSNLEPNLSEIKLNRLSRFQLLERIRQHFWARWSKEYLQQLQVRKKWTQNISPSVRNGQLVLLQEDGIPPLLWPTGRIVAVHPGVDGIVRAATVKTVRGEVKRPTNKLCVLPME